MGDDGVTAFSVDLIHARKHIIHLYQGSVVQLVNEARLNVGRHKVFMHTYIEKILDENNII
jgi:hypothetical protein